MGKLPAGKNSHSPQDKDTLANGNVADCLHRAILERMFILHEISVSLYRVHCLAIELLTMKSSDGVGPQLVVQKLRT